MPGLYSYDSPRKLFEKLVRDFTEFCASPSDDGVFAVVFPLYHLREWICPGNPEQIERKPEAQRTPEEKLHVTLHAMPEFRTVRALCNHAKHFELNKDSLDGRTEKLHGARCGLMRAGDSLGVTHFTVDGVEVRTIFWPVYEIYFEYFKQAAA